MKIRVYLASQIFAECWRDYNEKIGKMIEERFPEVELYMPQRNKTINDKTKCATAEDIAKGDFDDNLEHDDLMIAGVDGDTPGIGTTLEIGYFAHICEQERRSCNAYGRKPKKKIISLYTDSRECSHTINDAKVDAMHGFAESQFSYINLLLVGALKRYGVMCYTIEEMLDELGKALEEYKKEEEFPF